jgi:hypothetical protein
MTRTEKRLLLKANERARLMERIKKNEREHKSTKDLQARLVDATRQQIKAELSLERKQRAA